MLKLEFKASLDDTWIDVPVVAVGDQRSAGLRGPSASVLVNCERRFRIDLHAFPDDYSAFEDAVLWHQHAFVGFGSSVYVVSLDDRSAVVVGLDGYFGSFAQGDGYLLAASASRLIRFAPTGDVVWTSEILGLDGVVVSSASSSTIVGDGEWDPPGGWRRFVLDASNGAAG